MSKFSTNPFMFKVNYVNRDFFESANGISGILGSAFHHAMEIYYGGNDEIVITSEAEAIEQGLKAGLEYLENTPDGFIKYTKTIPDKQTAREKLSFCFNSYIKEMPYNPSVVIGTEQEVVELIDVDWNGERLTLPIPLKGRLDLIEKHEDGKVKIIDYKTCKDFSKEDKIDAKKIVQSVCYYFLMYAKTGIAPYSLIFREVKHTKNRDGGKQVIEYEVVYEENQLYFEFFFRFYSDMIRALSGEMVYVPNFDDIYDNEIAIISYIQRLDIPEEQAKLMKKHNVSNITDLLKKQLQSASNMKKLLKAVENQLVEVKNIDYSTMTTEEKIQTKLMEHGIVLKFDSKVEGSAVTLYRFVPSMGIKMSKIEAYAKDIEQVAETSGIRILAPIPDSGLVGFEIPNKVRTFPLETPPPKGFELSIGVDIMGNVVRKDIREMPHLLIGGTSGSGKSVCLVNLIEQIQTLGDKKKLILIDPKLVELSHLDCDIYADNPKQISKLLSGTVMMMEERYASLKAAKCRNIEDYHKKGKEGMTYMFIVIDEFGDLIVQDHTDPETGFNYSHEIKKNILILAAKARAAGIHLILTTQQPSVKIIDGAIKANFPTRIAFKTTSSVNSIVILDQPGAEKLLGQGDMLFLDPYKSSVVRLQGYKD